MCICIWKQKVVWILKLRENGWKVAASALRQVLQEAIIENARRRLNSKVAAPPYFAIMVLRCSQRPWEHDYGTDLQLDYPNQRNCLRPKFQRDELGSFWTF
jgi:hypothetical protein